MLLFLRGVVMRKIKLYTYWRLERLERCCPPQNRCLKDKECELMTFTYDEYEDVKGCMSARRYKRNKRGAIEQVK